MILNYLSINNSKKQDTNFKRLDIPSCVETQAARKILKRYHPKRDICIKYFNPNNEIWDLDNLPSGMGTAKLASEATMIKQLSSVSECAFVAALRSIGFGLNRYALKMKNPNFDFRAWREALLMTPPPSLLQGSILVLFPALKKIKLSLGVPTCKADSKISIIREAYGMLNKLTSHPEATSMEVALDYTFPASTFKYCAGLKSLLYIKPNDAAYNKRYKRFTKKLFERFKLFPENYAITVSTNENEFQSGKFKKDHAYSLKKVVDDGLLLVNPHNRRNKVEFVSFDDFYNYFGSISFARLTPEKMFNDIKIAHQTWRNDYHHNRTLDAVSIYNNHPTMSEKLRGLTRTSAFEFMRHGKTSSCWTARPLSELYTLSDPK